MTKFWPFFVWGGGGALWCAPRGKVFGGQKRSKKRSLNHRLVITRPDPIVALVPKVSFSLAPNFSAWVIGSSRLGMLCWCSERDCCSNTQNRIETRQQPLKDPAAPRAMRQRTLGSHTPPCHRRMVITTLPQGCPRLPQGGGT